MGQIPTGLKLVKDSQVVSEKLLCPKQTNPKTGEMVQLAYSPKYFSCIFPSEFPANAYPAPDYPTQLCSLSKNSKTLNKIGI